MHILHMNKGEGETSYAKSSLLQMNIISVGIPMVEAAIVNILCEVLQADESMGLADLGCSSGPNSLTVVSHIIQMVHATCNQMSRSFPEIRVSLNDLFGNDFNNVFELLPEFYKKLKGDYGIGGCYVCGLPGSFYGRLFPARSLHFVHSSSSLHWLSQVPVGLGTYLNKEKIYISKSSSAGVMEAYQQQFKQDFSAFLRSRAKEVIIKGRMVLSFMGRMSPNPFDDEVCFPWENLARALMSLASDGLLEKEMIDSFNTPYYAPTPKEVENEVAIERSFVVDGVEAFDIDWDGGDSSTIITESSGDRVAKTMRAVVEPMFGSHFHLGPELMDELFRRFTTFVNDCFSKRRYKFTILVVSLIKKY
ncbi:hypothetical protein LXL04_007339 [Taraxacum kok-saghyz]